MFAFAIWDARRRRLVLARDRVGKKPLFYALHDGALSFASELRALLEDPGSRASSTIGALDAYLALRYVPAPHSAFDGVSEAAAGARLLVLERRRSPNRALLERSTTTASARPRTARRHSSEIRGGDQALRAAPDGRGRARSGRSSRAASTPPPSSRRWRRHRREPVKTFSIGFSTRTASTSSPQREADRRAIRHRARGVRRGPAGGRDRAAARRPTTASRSPTPRRSRPSTWPSWPAATSRSR